MFGTEGEGPGMHKLATRGAWRDRVRGARLQELAIGSGPHGRPPQANDRMVWLEVNGCIG
eukprot:350015-Chlamydomonas_euryale.AAC.3